MLFSLCALSATAVAAEPEERSGVRSERQQERQPKIEIEHPSYDFGKFVIKGNKKSHSFRYTNTGNAPLIIQRVTANCNCIDAKFSRRPLAPGESGEITIIYDPKKELGAFNKGVHVRTNAGETIIFVKGEVLGSNKKK